MKKNRNFVKNQLNMRYLDPKNDLTFKRIFGEHPHLCMSLLNSLLPLNESQQIVSLEYQSGEMVPEIPLLKNSIVDVRCTDVLGRQFIVEMQMYWTDSFKNRVVFNASKAYVKQLDSSQEYKLLQPVYALNLVNEIFEPTMNDYYHHYKIINIHNNEKQIDGLEFVFVELPKFKARNITEKKIQVLWLKFLTEINENTENIPEELFEDSEIKEAIQYLENSSYSKAQLATYDKYWDTIRTEKSAYLDAEERGRIEGEHAGFKKGEEVGLTKGVEVGFIKGEQIGIQKGEQIGIQKGEQIGVQKGELMGIQKVAQNAKLMGLDVNSISELTGLSQEEIMLL